MPRRRYRNQQQCSILDPARKRNVAISDKEPLFPWDQARALVERRSESGTTDWGVKMLNDEILLATENGLRVSTASENQSDTQRASWQPIDKTDIDADGWKWSIEDGVTLKKTIAGRELISKLIAVPATGETLPIKPPQGYLLQRDRIIDVSVANVSAQVCTGDTDNTSTVPCLYSLIELGEEGSRIMAITRRALSADAPRFGATRPVDSHATAILATNAGLWIANSGRLSLWNHTLNGRHISIPKIGLDAAASQALQINASADESQVLLMQPSGKSLGQLAVAGLRQWEHSGGHAFSNDASAHRQADAVTGALMCYEVQSGKALGDEDCVTTNENTVTIARKLAAKDSQRWSGWSYGVQADGSFCIAREVHCNAEIPQSGTSSFDVALRYESADGTNAHFFPRARSSPPATRIIAAGLWLAELEMAEHAWQDGREPLLALHRARDIFANEDCGGAVSAVWDAASNQNRWHVRSQNGCNASSGPQVTASLPAPFRKATHIRLAGWLAGRAQQPAALHFQRDNEGWWLSYPQLGPTPHPHPLGTRINNVWPTSAGILLDTHHGLYEFHDTETALLAYPPLSLPSQ